MAAQSRAPADRAAVPGPGDALARRRLLFFACFLVGPFAESATGFGVGMLGTVLLIRPLNLQPRETMVFALPSQTLIPWGAMGSGTLLASAYARVPASELALYSMVPVALLMALWMALYWRTAARAGLRAPTSECWREAGLMAASLAALAAATAVLGPETALLSGLRPAGGPARARPPPRAQLLAAGAQRPALHPDEIARLVATRLLPGLELRPVRRWARSTRSPTYPPGNPSRTRAAGSSPARWPWRRCGASRGVAGQARAAWTTGRHAVYIGFSCSR